LYNHYKKDDRIDIQTQVRQMEADLELCSKYIEMYKEFLKDKPIEEIMNKVEKEQQEARNEERKIKSRKSIQSVKNSSGNGLIVKLDGSVVKDENEEKLIIGNMVQGKIEDEQWRNLRR
jgi:GTPase involved in cell partitioning and DNA repair